MNREELPVVAVRFEGTIALWDEKLLDGEPNGEAIAALTALSEKYRIVIVTPQSATSLGLTRVRGWLLRHGVSYDDIHCTFAYPDTRVTFDNEARKLP